MIKRFILTVFLRHLLINIIGRKFQGNSSEYSNSNLPWKMDAHGTDYTTPFILPMGKDVDKKRLETVLKQWIRPHEGLRTSFLMVAEHPVQPVHDDVPFPLDDVKPGPDAP
ncbi:MAG: hypothetical protein GY940_13520, partial [bacterium]|nr:hypothetical protein [bacterium]